MGEIRRALGALVVIAVWTVPSSAQPGPRFEPQCPPPAMFFAFCVRYA